MSVDPIDNHLKITPSPMCMEKIAEFECGHGVSIVNGLEIFVGENVAHMYKGKSWSQLRSEAVYLPAVESYAPLAEYMINSCKKMRCDNQLEAFRVKIDSLKSIKGGFH